MSEQILSDEKQLIKNLLNQTEEIKIESFREKLADSLISHNSQLDFTDPQELFEYIRYLNRHNIRYKMKKRSFKQSIKSMIPFSLILLLGEFFITDPLMRIVPIILIILLTFVNMILPTKTLIITENFND